MAFGAKQIFPNDLRPRVAIGVNLPFNGPGVMVPNYQTKEAIKNNIINYFLTEPGERPANPTFGAGLRRYIFNQITNDNLDFIQEDIQQKIASQFPEITVNSVEVFGQPDFNIINIVIAYNIRNVKDDKVEFTFNYQL
jgi:phage baseplate assembly protein W